MEILSELQIGNEVYLSEFSKCSDKFRIANGIKVANNSDDFIYANRNCTSRDINDWSIRIRGRPASFFRPRNIADNSPRSICYGYRWDTSSGQIEFARAKFFKEQFNFVLERRIQ